MPVVWPVSATAAPIPDKPLGSRVGWPRAVPAATEQRGQAPSVGSGLGLYERVADQQALPHQATDERINVLEVGELPRRVASQKEPPPDSGSVSAASTRCVNGRLGMNAPSSNWMPTNSPSPVVIGTTEAAVSGPRTVKYVRPRSFVTPIPVGHCDRDEPLGQHAASAPDLLDERRVAGALVEDIELRSARERLVGGHVELEAHC